MQARESDERGSYIAVPAGGQAPGGPTMAAATPDRRPAIGTSAAAQLPLLLALLELASSLLFTPASRTDVMADLWLYRRPSDGMYLLNYLVQSNSSDQHCPPPTWCSWNGVSSAVSSDGVHFKDLGVVLRKDCAGGQRHASESGPQAANCATWLGSGSVWPLLRNTTALSGAEAEAETEDAAADDEWVMNFSQEYDCQESCQGGVNSSACNCQSMFFATSKDLLTWTPVSPNAEQQPSPLVFKYDSRHYFTAGTNPQQSRWDCMSAIAKPGGGYYAYWTASPISSAGSCHGPQTAPPNWTRSCGAGMGESEDGLHWRALPSPGPTYASAELGGVAVVNGSVWMLFDEGHLFRAESPLGPFVPAEKNFDFLDQSVGVGFPRFWGSVYTGSSNVTLLTHNQMLRTTAYAALTKQVEVGADGVLRAVYWSGNDVLRGEALTIAPSAPRSAQSAPAAAAGGAAAAAAAAAAVDLNRTSCIGQCLTSGLWIEGKLAPGELSGVWLQLADQSSQQQRQQQRQHQQRQHQHQQHQQPGVAFMFDARASAGGVFRMGVVASPAAAANGTALPTVVDRAMQEVATDTALTFKLVMRNSWTEASMVRKMPCLSHFILKTINSLRQAWDKHRKT